MTPSGWLWKHRRWLAEVWAPATSILANLIVVATVILAVATYQQQQATTAQQASLGYVERFNSGEVLDARNVIYESWLPYDLSGVEAVSPDVVKELLHRMLSGADQEAGTRMRIAMATIVTFFDGVQACLAEAVCGAGVLTSQLGEYAVDFHCLYGGVIKEEATTRRLVTFGEGLEAFASRVRSCQ